MKERSRPLLLPELLGRIESASPSRWTLCQIDCLDETSIAIATSMYSIWQNLLSHPEKEGVHVDVVLLYFLEILLR